MIDSASASMASASETSETNASVAVEEQGVQEGLNKQKAPKTLIFQYVVIITMITTIVVALMLYSLQMMWMTQAEERMAAEARVLNTSVTVMWDFIDREQNLINTDRDGTYNFKGLYCSLVGKSVGELFSRQTGYQYTLSYIRENPRNALDAPDSYEATALEAFNNGSSEYYGFETGANGKSVFRYVGAIYLTESCLGCHGGPVGELDATGAPKEGMSAGDIGGAVSIVIPAESYEQTAKVNITVSVAIVILLITVIIGASTIFFRIRVATPINRLGESLDEIRQGNLDAEIDHDFTSFEMSELTSGVKSMTRDLSRLYQTLEDRVDERTQMYREANDLLQSQRDQLETQRAQIARANRLLTEVNEKLEDENEYRSTIISILSHELRTPLTSIIAYTDLWEHSDDKSEDASYVAAIKKQSNSLLEMASNVLDLAKIESGRMKPAHEIVDFVDLLAEVEDEIHLLADAKSIQITTHVAPNVPLIASDWALLKKILMNLLSNAIKFTRDGGNVEASVSCESRDGVANGTNSAIALGAGTIKLTVADDGIGISKKDLIGIFDRFVQVDSSFTRQHNGSGLGLSLVKKAAEALGGSVSVDSVVGRGSTFTVLLAADMIEDKDEE